MFIGGAQVEFETAAQFGAAFHFRFKEVIAPAALRLGALKAKIGIAKQRFVGRTIIWRHHDPDADAGNEFMILNVIAFRQRRHQLARNPTYLLRSRHSGKSDSEFITPSRATMSVGRRHSRSRLAATLSN